VITGDMGGTSFDVSLIAKGESRLAPQTSIDFGLVVRTPMIEITTIGAGGGSIAWVDRSGLLQVGPESAGSDPGPACYGAGNERPTVTDANVVLGRINAERPIGGKLARLDVDAARRALEAHIGKPLGLDALASAEAVIRVANAKMAGAIRLVSVERGHDPKQFAYMPFGGGGALHVCALMREVGIASGLVPRYPGVTSALGCVIADMRHDFVQTLNAPLASLDLAMLHGHLKRRWAEGEKLLAASGVKFEQVDRGLELDMLYQGQTHALAVPVAAAKPADVTREALASAFEASYRAAFGRLLAGIPIRVLNLRVVVTEASIRTAYLGRRKLWIEGGWRDVPVFKRLQLPAGSEVEGPAVFEQDDSTVYLEPGMLAEVDRYGNLVIKRS
jgi:N-methylhydantoinase A